ncbi:hypothetical protein ACTFIV_010760 [Dictyostelium citrinum]
MPLALTSRKSLKDNEKALKTNLAAIEKSLGEAFAIEFDFEDIIAKVADDLKNSFGHIFAGIVEKVAANLTKRCSDEMILEAVQEATSNHTIVIKHDANMSGYWKWSFESGNIVITFKSITNTNDVQTFDFIKLL